MPIELLFATSLALVVLTKLADLWTTLRGVTAGTETNPFGAFLFAKKSVGAGVAVVGLLAAVIIGVSYGVAWWMGPLAQLAVAALGVPIAIVQGAVAWTNHTNKSNAVTRLVARMHRKLPRL